METVNEQANADGLIGLNNGGQAQGSSSNNGGFPVNPNSTLPINPCQGIDYNHPLSIRLALLGRNKIGLIDGSCTKETISGELWGQWERVNAIVLSWLLNSVSKSILGGLAFSSSAFNVWTDLKERFDQLDGSRTFSLHKEIVTLQQGTNSVSVYYTKLKTLWDEFEAMVLSPGCNCEVSRGFVAHLNRQKLYQFLMGLNESFNQARSQILLMNPIPTVNQAYAMIISDECQKSVASSYTNSLGMNFVASSNVNSFGIYSRTGGNKGNESFNSGHTGGYAGPSSQLGTNARFKKNFNVICDFCKCKVHTKDQCYKLVEYPTGFKSKKKVYVSGNSGAAYNVINSQTMSQNDIFVHSPHVFNYGLNTNVPMSPKEKHLMTGVTNEVDEYAKQLQGCTFNKDQYKQILQMLNQSNNGGMPKGVDHVSAANTAGKTLLVFENSEVWIIDTGATNHMVSKIDMITKDSLRKTDSSKQVCLPNGDTAHVTHIGSCCISPRSIITNVLHLSKFKYNLMSVSKEIYNGKVQEIDKEDGGLYLLLNKLISNQLQEDTVTATSNVHNKHAIQKSEVELWHKRLGHVSSKVLNKLFSLDSQDVNRSVNKCTVCPSAKQTRFVFPISIIKSLDSFDLIHVDVWGPYKVATFDGNKYFLTVVDDFTRMKWLFLLKSKADVCVSLQHFLYFVKTQFG
ncbi:uncharacterized protein LOC107873996 [Capsicum annuum]|uniref:uncharacterized protein LOC107873996 n=1 Tax=Capsicum annuum TaxID=4072 RepID=UPI001FB19AE1|nr:uncharacterized protein LOC107873996 [Capsicum annuum]